MKIRDLQQQVNEIDRRGFLKGLGAAAVAGAAGSAMAAPFRHGEYKDQMTGKTQGKYSILPSDNSNARITIIWPGSAQPGFVIDIPGEVLQLGIDGASGRIKINGKIENIYFNPMKDHGAYSSAGVLSDNIARKLLKSNGEVLIEIPVYGKGNKIYKFTVEPDSIVKQLKDPQPKKTEIKKDEPADAKLASAEEKRPEALRDENYKRMQGMAGDENPKGSALKASGPSAGYAGRIRARIKPNITFTEDVTGNPKAEVEVRTSPDGTILSRKLLSSSGNKAWDEAVLKAIDKTANLPRDEDGRVPPVLEISFRPKD